MAKNIPTDQLPPAASILDDEKITAGLDHNISQAISRSDNGKTPKNDIGAFLLLITIGVVLLLILVYLFGVHDLNPGTAAD